MLELYGYCEITLEKRCLKSSSRYGRLSQHRPHHGSLRASVLLAGVDDAFEPPRLVI